MFRHGEESSLTERGQTQSGKTRAASVPKPIESVGREPRIANRVLNVPMSQIFLNRPCIDTLVGEVVTRAMSKHVGVNR